LEVGNVRNSRFGVAQLGTVRVRGMFVSALSVLAFLGIESVIAGPAGAHSGLKSSTPAAGSVIASAPASAALIFDEGILSMSLTVTDGCGRTVPAQVSIRNREVQAALRPGDQAPASGPWSLRWKAVGADGHPVTGEVAFIVSGTADCAAPGLQPGGAAAVAGDQSDAPATTSTDGPQAQDADEAVSAGSRTVSRGVLVAVAVMVLGVGAAVLARRGRSPPAPAREKPCRPRRRSTSRCARSPSDPRCCWSARFRWRCSS
jgi:methionine-rich copper-binding protein CopC